LKSTAVIIGYSGHAYVVIDALLSNKFEIIGYCEQQQKANDPFKLQYLGKEGDSNLQELLKNNEVYIGIGDNKIRAKILNGLHSNSIACPVLVHASAIISQTAKIGQGSVVLPGAVINSCAQVGKAVICNSSSVIEHECNVGDYCHIAPGAVLAGNVQVGPYSFIGANAVVKQGLVIGANVVIGAGAVVTKDIESGWVVYGNPAKRK